MVSRGDERSKLTLLFRRARSRRSATRDVLPRAGDHLPCVSLGEPKDTRDVAICIVERLAKDVGGAFGRCQLFQQHANAKGQGLPVLD